MNSSVKYDFSGLQALVKFIDDKHVVKVGIFADENQRNETGSFSAKLGHRRKGKKVAEKTNAEIGAKHEFGSFSDHIPMRSFIRMPLFARSQQIIKEASVGALKLIAQGNKVMLLKRLGIACENAIQLAFATHGFNRWAPNKISTAERKGSGSPLIDTSQMRRSIASKVEAL